MSDFSHPNIVKRSGTIDVIWFNERKVPNGFFEIERSRDIQNSLLRFKDLQDFGARMLIVSSGKAKKEFESKIRYSSSFEAISKRAYFLSFDWLAKEYERAIGASHQ